MTIGGRVVELDVELDSAESRAMLGMAQSRLEELPIDSLSRQAIVASARNFEGSVSSFMSALEKSGGASEIEALSAALSVEGERVEIVVDYGVVGGASGDHVLAVHVDLISGNVTHVEVES